MKKKWSRLTLLMVLFVYLAATPVYGAQKQDGVLQVQLTQFYDESSGCFLQMMEEEIGFSSTIPQNLITTGGVRLDHFTEGMVYFLERNGKEVSYESGQVITESGQYHLRLFMMPQLNLEGMEEPTLEQLQDDAFMLEKLSILNRTDTITADFYFTILETAVSDRNYVNAPEGYRIAQVVLDHTEVPLLEDRWCRTEKDGSYFIQFQPETGAMPNYELAFQKDTQPPRLIFYGIDSMGTAKKSVQYQSSEEYSAVEIYRDGRQMEADGEIRTPGLYRLIVRDAAGNATSYLIQIKSAYPRILLFGLLGGLFILAGGTFLMFRHQKITVR